MRRVQIPIVCGAIAALIILLIPAAGGEESPKKVHDSERVAKWIGQCAERLSKSQTRFPKVEILHGNSEWRINVGCAAKPAPENEIQGKPKVDAHPVPNTHGFSITVRRAFSPSPSLSLAIHGGTKKRLGEGDRRSSQRFWRTRPGSAHFQWKHREWSVLDDGSMVASLSGFSSDSGDHFSVHAQRSKSVTSDDAKVIDALLQAFAEAFSIPRAEQDEDGQAAAAFESKP